MNVEKTYDKLYRYVYFKMHSQEIAEDITQETFLRYIGRYGQSGSYNMRIMYTIARNLCIDEFRKDVHIPLSDDCEVPQDDNQSDFDERLIIIDALDRLTEEEKGMLLLRYVNDESMTTISELYKCSRFSTYRRLKNAVKKLREYMEVKDLDG